MGRFLNVVLFLMVVAFGLVPAAALAQQPRVVRENGQDVLLVPVRGRMDLGAVVRLANQHAAPGTAITADDVVEANPGKINYVCYYRRGRENHYGSRNATNWNTCPRAQRWRWVVTGLEYRVPLQSVAAEQNVVSSLPTPGESTQPAAAADHLSATATVATPRSRGLTHQQREEMLLEIQSAIARAEAGFQAQRRALVRTMVTQLQMAEMRQEQARLNNVLICLVMAAIFSIMWALWSAYRDRASRAVAGVPGPSALAFAGVPVLTDPTPSPAARPDIQALIQEAVQRAVTPVASARDAANARVKNLEADRNALAAQLEQERSRKDPVPVVPPPPAPASRVSDWRAVGEPERNPKGTAQALGVALTEKLDALHRVDIDLEKKRKHLWIVENDLPSDSQRHREMAAKLTPEIQSLEDVRTVLVLAINTLTSNMYGRVFPDLLRSDKERWARINKQAVKALRQEFALGLGRVSELEVALSNAQSAEKVATDEVARQTQFREEEVARLNASLAELRTENQRMTEELAESEESGRDQDRQIDDLSSQLVALTGRLADLEVELATVAGERDLLKREVVNLIAMIDDQANGHGPNLNGASTRKTTQPFAAVQRTPPPAAPSPGRSSQKGRGKT